MKEIFKTLKKYTFFIIIILVLLVIQAYCDLSLPEYTSKIVNVGIQQSGIEYAAPKAIRKSTMDTLLLFMEDDSILNYYTLESKGSAYENEYPILKEEELYILKEDNQEEVSQKISLPWMVLAALESGQMNEILHVPDGMNAMDMMQAMDSSTRLKIVEQYQNMPESIVNQTAIAMVLNEYKAIEVNVETIQFQYLIKIGLIMSLLALLAMGISIMTTFYSARIAAYFSHDLRSKVVSKVMTYSNQEFESFSTASLITRSTNDIQQIQMLIVMLLRVVFYAPIVGFGALSKVSGSSMGWVIALALLVIMSIVILLFVVAMPKFSKVQKLVDKVNLVAREILSGLPVIRAFGNEKHEENRFDTANKDLMKVNLFVNRVMSIMMPTMMFIMNGVSILIIWVGSSKIDAGTMQVGNLLAFITYTMQIIMSFLMISMVSIMIPRSFVSMKRIGEVLKKDSSIQDPIHPKKFPKDMQGVIEFKDVYFRYPDAEEDVLQNISFKIQKGTTTAFIGSTGSGKSTLINLIPRFFDVTGGKILVDGVCIKDVKLKDLRSKIGFVPQKGILFTGTIDSNIRFGNPKMNQSMVKKAAQISQSEEFILEKEEQYKSAIAQGGTNVSGGQRQRLAIARAIARNPEIYIFDDSFSALDYKTDVALRKALAKEVKDSTILIVAQRISTVMHADQIIVLDKGNIVGIGTHKELMKTCQIYQEIALSQLKKEELA